MRLLEGAPPRAGGAPGFRARRCRRSAGCLDENVQVEPMAPVVRYTIPTVIVSPSVPLTSDCQGLLRRSAGSSRCGSPQESGGVWVIAAGNAGRMNVRIGTRSRPGVVAGSRPADGIEPRVVPGNVRPGDVLPGDLEILGAVVDEREQRRAAGRVCGDRPEDRRQRGDAAGGRRSPPPSGSGTWATATVLGGRGDCAPGGNAEVSQLNDAARAGGRCCCRAGDDGAEVFVITVKPVNGRPRRPTRPSPGRSPSGRRAGDGEVPPGRAVAAGSGAPLRQGIRQALRPETR